MQHQDSATVFVELKKPMQLYSEEEIHRIKSALDRQLKEIVIVRLNTKLVDPETLQRYEGKARRVEDLRYIEK